MNSRFGSSWGRLAFSASVLAICAASAVRAQDAAAVKATDNTVGIPAELVVTGVVKKTRKVDTTFTIDTIDQREIQRLSPISTADLLNNIPGFFAEGSTAGEASNNITVRGLPVTGGYRYAPQLIDGLPVFQEPDVPFMNNDVFIRTDLMTERVEAIKGGPGGILYSNGLGAVVNYTTKTGGDTFEGGYKLEVANYGFIRNDAYLSGPINDNLHFAVGGFYRTSHGVRNTGYTADRGGQIRANLTYKSNDDKTQFAVYGQYINDRTAFFQNLPIEVPGFTNPGTAANPIVINQNTVKPIGLNFQNGTTLSPFNRYITQFGEYGQRKTDIGDGIHPDFKTVTVKFSRELDSGWKFSANANFTSGSSGFNTIFTGNDASTAASFLGNRFTNDVLQPAFDAQWQQSEGNPNNAPFQNRYKLATYFNSLSPADFNSNYKQPILDSGFSRFNELRSAWGNATAKAGGGVGVGAFYNDGGAPVSASTNLTFLIPWIVQTKASSSVQDFRIEKDLEFAGDHHLTAGFYHSDYSDSYNFQASLVVSTLDSPTRLVNMSVVNAAGAPVGPSLSINGSFLPGFYGNVVSGGAENYAGFVQDHWEAFDHRLKIDAGFRWETEKSNIVFQNRQCCTSLLPANSTTGSPALNEIQEPGDQKFLNQRYNGHGWSIGANYALRHNLAVYALASRSFRLPSFNDAIGFAQSAPITDPVEHITQFEGGARYQSQIFDASAAIYYNKFSPRSLVNTYQDFKSPSCSSVGGVPNINSCPQVAQPYSFGIKNFGAELELVVRPPFLKGFEVKNDIVIQDPRVNGSSFLNVITDTNPANGNITGYHFVTISRDGRRPGRLAALNLNIQPSWNLKPLTNLPIKLYGQYEYHSTRYSNADDFNVTLYPAYYVANAGMLIDLTNKMSVQLHVANITNQLTFTEGDPLFNDLKAPDGTGNRGVARPLFGRTYRAFFSYRF